MNRRHHRADLCYLILQHSLDLELDLYLEVEILKRSQLLGLVNIFYSLSNTLIIFAVFFNYGANNNPNPIAGPGKLISMFLHLTCVGSLGEMAKD
jgi:hypothetical protein